jgi:SecD/SecF fusion protein
MQNLQGVVRFFTITLILACLFQLSFTFLASSVEHKADTYTDAHVKEVAQTGATPLQQVAYSDSIAYVKKIYKRNFLDSIAGTPIVNVWGLKEIYTYKFCRDHALTLGLDLKGGMSLIMEISEDDVLRRLAGNSGKQPQFRQAIENAKKTQQTTPGDFLTIFQKEFEKLNPSAKLAAIFSTSDAYQGKILITSTNDEVIAILRKDFDAAIKETFQHIATGKYRQNNT